jgi:hypothetical protein
MDKIQKAAAVKVFLNLASIAALIVAARVLIELVGVQVFGIMIVAAIGVFLVKFMYDNEVDRARILDRLNNPADRDSV